MILFGSWLLAKLLMIWNILWNLVEWLGLKFQPFPFLGGAKPASRESRAKSAPLSALAAWAREDLCLDLGIAKNRSHPTKWLHVAARCILEFLGLSYICVHISMSSLLKVSIGGFYVFMLVYWSPTLSYSSFRSRPAYLITLA